MNINVLWRDIRFLKILAQVIFVIALALVAGYLYSNVTTNLARQGLTVGYGFIKNPASFGIGESFVPYQPSDTYGHALLVGLVNTLVVSALGILLTTIVGVLAGVARLSSNWLINKFAAAYVGVIRNTPLLLQLMFWYFGVAIQLPGVRQAIKLPGPIYLSQRGVYLSWAETTATFPAWRVYIIIALISIFGVWFALRFARKRASVPLSPWWNLTYLLIPALIVWLGATLQPEPPLRPFFPELSGLNFRADYVSPPNLLPCCLVWSFIPGHSLQRSCALASRRFRGGKWRRRARSG
jgi:general L-amino acid transport system permease protein